MEKITSLSLIFLFNLAILGQCPTTNITLSSQEEIDNFSINYPNCTILTHELKIDGETNSITNLNGLSLITNAQDIFITQAEITFFYGLDNLETVSRFALWGNVNLQNLEGLSSLVSVNDLEIWVNNGITSLEGIDNLQTISNINLFGNSSLTDISQLSFLSSIDNLTLGDNALTNLNGLENLLEVQFDLSISKEQIQNFNQLSGLQTIGGSLYIFNNDNVQNITAFNNIESLIDLYVVNCRNLIDLSGLENIHTISGRLRIGFNSELTNLNFISNISSVDYIDIFENENLQSLGGLENLTEINQRLFIDSNPNLISIEAINNVAPSEIDEVVFINNSSLEVCNNEFVCSIISDSNVAKFIVNNADGCNSIQEVEESCLLGFNENNIANQIVVYPNPFLDYFSIYVSDALRLNSVIIYSVLGEKLLETSINHINLVSFSTGIYFAEIITNQGSIVKRIVKE